MEKEPEYDLESVDEGEIKDGLGGATEDFIVALNDDDTVENVLKGYKKLHKTSVQCPLLTLRSN